MFISAFLIISILAPRVISYTVPSNSPPNTDTSKIITQFPNPTWVENIAARSNGNLLVTLLSPGPYIYTITPPSPQLPSITNPSTSTLLLANLTTTQKSTLLGITETKPDTFYIIGGNFTSVTDPGPGTYSIFSIDLTANTGTSEINPDEIQKIADLPDADMLNGLATLSIEKNLIIASDSFGGHIWLIDTLTGATSILLSDPTTMLPPNGSSVIPLGINGLRVLDTEDKDRVFIYYSNMAAGIIYRVLFGLENMEIIGEVETLVTGLEVDDFAVDEKRGVLWLAGGGMNGIFRAPLSGGMPVEVLGGQNDTIVEGATSCAVGRGRTDERVFCTTDGGLAAPINGTVTVGGRVVEVIDTGGD